MPRRKPYAADTTVLEATDAAIAAATHLGPTDAGAVAALRALALKVDMADEYFEKLADYAASKQLRPPSPDNVSLPTYLKFAESLGLTPTGRTKLAAPKTPEATGGSKDGTVAVGRFRSVAGGKA